jgi:glycosyltransferase involved in cell wall biosynthesis
LIGNARDASRPPLRILSIEAADREMSAEYHVHSGLALAAGSAIEMRVLCHPAVVESPPDELVRWPLDLTMGQGGRIRRRLAWMVRYPRVLKAALRHARLFQPHIVYSSQQRRDIVTAALIALVIRAPRVAHVHYVFGPWLGFTPQWLVRRSAHIIAASESVRQTLLLRGVNPTRVTSVINGLAADEPSKLTREEARARAGVPRDADVVAVVGRLDRRKGHELLLRALPDVAKAFEHLQVLFCGVSTQAPEYEHDLRALCSRLGLDRVVQFCGHRNDVPVVLRAADVFCLPCEQEAVGMVFLEAMRAGLPAVGLYSGGVPEIVVDGCTGFLSYPGDAQQLSMNLVRLLSDPGRAAAMGRAGFDRLAIQFDPAILSRRWVDILQPLSSGDSA